MTEQEKINRINEITTWFAKYDQQVNQYERCKRLGIPFDKNINDLDEQARDYADELVELRSK